MGCLPYFKFYPGDWLSDGAVRTMSPEARGVYWDLLAIAWQEGGIPADPTPLASWLGLTPRRFARIWAEVAPLWESTGNGRLVNPRLERERLAVEASHRAKVKAGRKGGKAKAANRQQQSRK